MDTLGLIVELGEDKGELIFNLHRHLEAGTMVVR
jgi:hypothetical protein